MFFQNHDANDSFAGSLGILIFLVVGVRPTDRGVTRIRHRPKAAVKGSAEFW